MSREHVAINGELGSGKSTVAKLLAAALDKRLLSTGSLQRELAASRGLTTLEANVQAETDDTIDRFIDERLVTEGREGPPTVFDSRLAWHFVPDAFKVHLVVHPEVGAQRMWGRGRSEAEGYDSVEAAMAGAIARGNSERSRFLEKYDIDISRLGNYDLVVDTSDATIDDVVDVIRRAVTSEDPRMLWVSPRRVELIGEGDRTPDPNSRGLVRVRYARPNFFAVRDIGRLAWLVNRGETLVPAELETEGERAAPEA